MIQKFYFTIKDNTFKNNFENQKIYTKINIYIITEIFQQMIGGKYER